MVEPKKKRVLLMDDAFGPRITLAALLEDAGFEVVEAGSLAEGRTRISDGQFTLAVLDLNLADGLGTELVPELLRRQPLTRIAILSGSDLERPQGVALVLTKAAAPAALVQQLCALVTS